LSERKREPRRYPPGHKAVETYLGGWPLAEWEPGTLGTEHAQDVLRAVHATAAGRAGQRYQECTDPPYHALSWMDGKGVVDDVVDVLNHESNVQLLFFNGIYDIVCNHVGNEKFLENLPWEHADKWKRSDRYAWVAPSEREGMVSGYMKEHRNLKFLKVLDSGHMVPVDVPSQAADMMRTFIYNQSFKSSRQELDAAGDERGSCPVCPVCRERDSGADDGKQPPPPANSPSGGVGAFVVSYAWLAAGVGFAAVVAAALVVRGRRRRWSSSSSGLASQRAMVPQYDVELRESRYTDEPQEEEEEEEENGVDKEESIQANGSYA
jgi:carboxypeptidase D